MNNDLISREALKKELIDNAPTVSDRSLCDTCKYMFTCKDSDVGISWANHSVCNWYVPVKNEEGSAKND